MQPPQNSNATTTACIRCGEGLGLAGWTWSRIHLPLSCWVTCSDTHVNEGCHSLGPSHGHVRWRRQYAVRSRTIAWSRRDASSSCMLHIRMVRVGDQPWFSAWTCATLQLTRMVRRQPVVWSPFPAAKSCPPSRSVETTERKWIGARVILSNNRGSQPGK